MTTVTIDRALIEQALEAIELNWKTDEGDAVKPLLRAALAEPAVKPVKGLFVDLIAQHPGLAEELAAIVIDAPPAEPAVDRKTSAMHAAVRKVLQYHGLVKGSDGVVEADLIYAVLDAPSPPAEPESGVCPTCISLSRAVMLDQTGSA